MTAFSIGGDWTWLGTMTFSGSILGSPDLTLDASGNIFIGSTSALEVNVGNGSTASTWVGTQFQISLSTAFLADAPSIEIANSAATSVLIGNGNATVNIFGLDMSIIGASTLDLDCSAVLQLGQSDATTIQIGNAGTTSLTITGAIPPDIGGSVPVMWNAGTQQFYHA